jgi:YidC/Oxa1 family membrane protein insertase
MNISYKSFKETTATDSFKLTYLESRASNPPDKLVVDDVEYVIRPGLQVRIRKGSQYKVMSKDSASMRIFSRKKYLNTDIIPFFNKINIKGLMRGSSRGRGNQNLLSLPFISACFILFLNHILEKTQLHFLKFLSRLMGNFDRPDQKKTVNEITRKEALNQNERIQFENQNIVGSISLKGAAIDDLTFKEYNVALNSNDKVTLLRPRNTKDGYFIESGFTTSAKNIDIPNSNSVWSVSGNNKLTNQSPVRLSWTNDQGITFEKEINLDDKFLFTIKQKVINTTKKEFDFCTYGQIIRNQKPDILNFFILHEGLIAVLDEELIERDYDDIQEENFSKNSQKGWLGISDKYWITSLIPPSGKKFETRFGHTEPEKFSASFVCTHSGIEDTLHVIVAPKRVDVIDEYAESLNIDQFDLAIDWGWLYFITKPLFYGIDYFFKLLGNYGLAIIAITFCFRLAFFPLANYSFKAMAKMNAIQPEMARLFDLHKKDKKKLQQEMMALYKKENVNPAFGLLPMVVQIPVFLALYKVLFVTIEMRQMPFFGWIKDLSVKDPTSLFNLFGLLPYGAPSLPPLLSFLEIGAWPIAMGVSMFISLRLNPAPPDPIQAKIFMFLPFLFTATTASFPAGLVIYWTVNNILMIAQQVFIMKRTTIKTAT